MRLIILGSLIYFGVFLGEDALSYFRLRDAMGQEARFAKTRTDDQMKDRLRAFTDSVKLPDAAKNINIVRGDNRIRIWSDYDQEVQLPFNQTRTIHLRPSAEATF
ncbi:MAG: hypothetical protein ACRD3J_11930 [Thermoanaerobaculia bacterium]